MKHSPPYHNQRVLMSIFSLFGLPKMLLDLGSGDGTMVKLARTMGIRAVGIDLIAEPPDIRHDLTKNFDLRLTFDMILCIETAEHIPEGKARVLCENIFRHKHPNTRLIFSAAPNNQGGTGHMNCQHAGYWKQMLYDSGKWSFMERASAELALILKMTAGPMAEWLPSNVMVF